MRQTLNTLSDIPVLIYHESDQKPSKGLGEKQSYLRYVILQAEKYNQKVVLFGDQYNKKWASEWEDVGAYLGDKWDRFERDFVNMSDYPDKWARGIFKRFFIFEEYCRRYGYDDFITIDSDVLLYIDLGKYPFRDLCEVALEWKGGMLFNGNDVSKGAVSGIGYFTLNSVSSFTDFCIDTYRDKNSESFKRLVKTWEQMRREKKIGGICEMTLLYYWLCYMDIKAVNLLERCQKACFCTDLRGKGNLCKNEFCVDHMLNTKRIRFIDGLPHHFDPHEDGWVKVFDIHFGGDSKRFIPDIYYRKHISAYNYIYYFIMRIWRSKIKPLLKEHNLRLSTSK